MRKLLLRVPLLRWCALQHLLQVRKKRQEAAWLYTHSILAALGEATIGFAGIGLILNRFIEGHHQQIGDIPLRNGLPRNFTAKLDYLEDVERHPNWNPNRLAELRQMRLELVDLNRRRIEVTHGLLMRRGYGPDFSVHIAKEGQTSLQRRTIPYSGQDVVQLAKDIADMGGRLSRFFMPMLSK